jgi:dihydroxyacid dehydratase/phosphogluconate dehydratase
MWGAVIGHVAPEEFSRGWIGLLEIGDLLYLQLTRAAASACFDTLVSANYRETGLARCQGFRDRGDQIALANCVVDATMPARASFSTSSLSGRAGTQRAKVRSLRLAEASRTDWITIALDECWDRLV